MTLSAEERALKAVRQAYADLLALLKTDRDNAIKDGAQSAGVFVETLDRVIALLDNLKVSFAPPNRDRLAAWFAERHGIPATIWEAYKDKPGSNRLRDIQQAWADADAVLALNAPKGS